MADRVARDGSSTVGFPKMRSRSAVYSPWPGPNCCRKRAIPTGPRALTSASMPARRNSADVVALPSMGSAAFMVIYTPLAYINAASVPDVSPNVSAFLVSAALFEVYARRFPVEWLRVSVARL